MLAEYGEEEEEHEEEKQNNLRSKPVSNNVSAIHDKSKDKLPTVSPGRPNGF